MALLENSTFKTGIGGWRLLNLPGPVGPQITRNGTARSGDALYAMVRAGADRGAERNLDFACHKKRRLTLTTTV